MTLLNPIPTLTTELLLVRNPYPTILAGLSGWAFTESHQMNFTEVRKTAFTTELRWTKGQPFACVVSLRHITCIGISAVAHFFNRWAPRPAGLGAIPRGSHHARSGAAGARAWWRQPRARGSRLDVHTELFVCVGASRRAYEVVCLRGSPFWAQREVVHTLIVYTTPIDNWHM